MQVLVAIVHRSSVSSVVACGVFSAITPISVPDNDWAFIKANKYFKKFRFINSPVSYHLPQMSNVFPRKCENKIVRLQCGMTL